MGLVAPGGLKRTVYSASDRSPRARMKSAEDPGNEKSDAYALSGMVQTSRTGGRGDSAIQDSE